MYIALLSAMTDMNETAEESVYRVALEHTQAPHTASYFTCGNSGHLLPDPPGVGAVLVGAPLDWCIDAQKWRRRQPTCATASPCTSNVFF